MNFSTPAQPKRADAVVKKDVKEEVKPLVLDCPACKGLGLKSEKEFCPMCAGSGKAING